MDSSSDADDNMARMPNKKEQEDATMTTRNACKPETCIDGKSCSLYWGRLKKKKIRICKATNSRAV